MKAHWRWMIQGMLCAGAASFLVVVPAVNTLLEGTGYWAVGAAITSLDDTAGGSLRRLVDRTIGTLLGGFLAWSLFTAVTVNGRYTQTHWCRAVLLVLCFLWAYPWGLVRKWNPRHPLVSMLGAYTGYLIIATAYVRGGAFKTAAFRTVGVCLGVSVTAVVANVVFARRARDGVREGLRDALALVAEVLDPVLDLAAGLQPQQAAEFFNPARATVANVAARRQRLHQQLERFRAMRKLNRAARERKHGDALRTEDSSERPSRPMPLSRATTTMAAAVVATRIAPLPNVEALDQLPMLPFPRSCTRREGLSAMSPPAQPADRSFLTEIAAQLTMTDCSGFSGGSRASVLFTEAEAQLDTQRRSAVAQLSTAMRGLLDEEDKQRRAAWETTMQRFENCSMLLAQQADLLRAAKREVSCFDRAGVIFPFRRYQAASLQVQSLFNQIAALFFAVNSQVTQIASVRRNSLVALSPAGHTQAAADDGEQLCTLFAGVAAAYRHAQAFGDVLSAIVQHFKEALICASRSVDGQTFTEDAVKATDAAAAGIDVLLALRNQRRRLWCEIFARGMEGEFDVFQNSQLAEAWETLVGLDTATFRSLGVLEQEEFWHTYWISRDKLSVVANSLLLLRDTLYVLCDTIDSIVAAGPLQE